MSEKVKEGVIKTPNVKISDIQIGNRFRKELGDIPQLAKSIEDIGLLHSIVLDEDFNLIIGRRRIAAFEKLGRDEIPARIISIKDPVKAQIDENVVREDFTASEMDAIREYYEPEIKAEAKTRKTIGRPPSGKFPDGQKGRTRDKVAQLLGVSGRTLEKVAEIVKAAKADPDHFGDILKRVDSGKTSISHAHTKIKRWEKHKNPEPIPEGEWSVILADPPWPYYLTLRGAPDAHYKTMSKEDLLALKVPSAQNAVLFLWATNPQLEVALEAMRVWEYTYKTNMVWAKDIFGTGYYFRGQHELLLLGIKGDMPPPTEETRSSSVLMSPRRKHSQKPEEVYDLIESMYPNREYLELFARPIDRRENWTYWGLET